MCVGRVGGLIQGLEKSVCEFAHVCLCVGIWTYMCTQRDTGKLRHVEIMRMFCCSVIKDQKLCFCSASKKVLTFIWLSFSFTCEHIYQLIFHSYPWILTLVTLKFKQRKEVSQRKTAVFHTPPQHTPSLTPPELHFSETKSTGDQNKGQFLQFSTLKIAGGSLHLPARGLRICQFPQTCQTQRQMEDETAQQYLVLKTKRKEQGAKGGLHSWLWATLKGKPV